MSEPQQLIKVFYTCFQQRDWKGMLNCYHEDVFFYDPVFQDLQAPQARAMWEMLLTGAKDLQVSFSNIKCEPASAGESTATQDSTAARELTAAMKLTGPIVEETHGEETIPDTYGSCNWIATYTFSQTGRKVENKAKALFTFRDGKIIEHQDDFSLWRWSRQALGIPGILLGWTLFLQNKIRRQARRSLEKFMTRSSSPMV